MMWKLRSKTRGNQSTSNKINLLLCLHPKDFSLYFSSLSDEILSHCNCAIWYYPPHYDTVPKEVLQFHMDSMHLLIIPVTHTLLSSPCQLITKAVDYAKEKHISILPILQEPGLEEAFNQKFGALHTFSIYSEHYDEQLHTFLSGFLLESTLYKSIQTAFRSHIFISYRKKDIAYASQLMDTLQNHPNYIDLGIWYDSFLHPGRNFEDEIMSNLDESSAVVLIVTPHLLEKGNYVLTKEYPHTKQQKKTLLPVELVSLQGEEISLFSSLYPTISFHKLLHLNEWETLQENLSAALSSAPPVSHSVNQTYLLGLGYLYGIGTKKNPTNALKLLEQAAQDGLLSAMLKLASMYRTGFGAPIDYHRAIHWQRLAMEQIQNKQTLSKGDIQLLFALTYPMLSDIQQLQQLGDLPALSQKLLGYARQLGTDRYMILAYEICALSAQISGDIPTYLSYREQILQELEAHHATTEAYYPFFLSRLGATYVEYGQQSQAATLYKKLIKLLDHTGDSIPHTIHHRLMLARCYEEAGCYFLSIASYPRASRYLHKYKQLTAHLAEQTPIPIYQTEFASSLEHLGDLACQKQKFQDAQSFYQQALSIHQTLHQTLQSPRSLSNLILAHMRFLFLALKSQQYDPTTCNPHLEFLSANLPKLPTTCLEFSQTYSEGYILLNQFYAMFESQDLQLDYFYHALHFAKEHYHRYSCKRAYYKLLECYFSYYHPLFCQQFPLSEDEKADLQALLALTKNCPETQLAFPQQQIFISCQLVAAYGLNLAHEEFDQAAQTLYETSKHSCYQPLVQTLTYTCLKEMLQQNTKQLSGHINKLLTILNLLPPSELKHPLVRYAFLLVTLFQENF